MDDLRRKDASLSTRCLNALEEGPKTRRELTELLGVSRTTLGRVLAELMALGAVSSHTHPASGRGRPVETMRATPTVAAIGIDLTRGRGEIIAVSHSRREYVRLGTEESVLREDDGDGVAADPVAQLRYWCAQLVRELDRLKLDYSHLGYVACGVPFPVGSASHRGWNNEFDELRSQCMAAISEFFAAPILLANTIVIAAVNEYQRLGGAGANSMLYLRLDHGVSSCSIYRDQIILGAHGYSGEIGHFSIPGVAGQCRCGKSDCLELIASRGAILSAAGVETLEELQVALDEGDERAWEARRKAAHGVAQAIAHAVLLLNPAVIVLSGAVATQVPGFVAAVNEGLRHGVIPAMYQDTECILASSGPHGGVWGAIYAGQLALATGELAFRRA